MFIKRRQHEYCFFLMMIGYSSIDTVPIAISIKVEDRDGDTIVMNSVDEIELMAFCKFRNEEDSQPVNVRWNISNELLGRLNTSIPAHQHAYMLSLNSIDFDYGYIWISYDGAPISDTLYVKTNKCSIVGQPGNIRPKAKNGALNQFDLLGKSHSGTSSNLQMLLLNKKSRSLQVK